MTHTLELSSEKEFKIIIFSILKVLMKMVDNMWEKMNSFKRGIKMIRTK